MAGTAGVPGDAVALHAENGRPRMLLEDKDAQIAVLTAQNAEVAERVARPGRLISRKSGNSSIPPGAGDRPGRSRRNAGRAAAVAAGRASCRARRARTWPGGSTRTRPRTCSRMAAARSGPFSAPQRAGPVRLHAAVSAVRALAQKLARGLTSKRGDCAKARPDWGGVVSHHHLVRVLGGHRARRAGGAWPQAR
jgi:hypothetical protein